MKRTELKRTRIRRKGRPAVTQRQKGRIVCSARDYAELVWRVCFGQSCACGCGRKADTAHHVVPRAFGGDDLIDNMIPLAGDGTTLCHGAFTTRARTFDPDANVYITPEQVEQGIRRHLNENPAKLRYVLRKTSRPWLDTHYPEEAPC